jgi:transposase
MKQTNKVDFTGQTIYIGLDVHRKSWSVSIYLEHFEHKTFTQPPKVEVLVSYLKRHFPGAAYKAVYEAGYCGFWIHDNLRQKGVDCIVVNPADIPTTDKERTRKSDRIDCRKLARALRAGQIQGIWVPPRAKAEDRSLVRTRQAMVKKQTRCKNQIKGMLYLYGLQVDSSTSWSRNFIRSLEALQLECESGNLALKAYLSELVHLRQIIAKLNKDILSLARSDQYSESVRLLKSIPGIGTLNAMILLTEIGDISRFQGLDRLASYMGITPDSRSSGDKESPGDLTRRGNRHLRYLLIESSWTAVRKDPALSAAFNQMCMRTLKTKAIVKIARKLLNRIRFVLGNKVQYLPMAA